MSSSCISPLKDGLAWIRIGSCSKLIHNNPVGRHVSTVSFTAQVATLIGDSTCGCDMKSVRKRIHIRQECMMMSFYKMMSSCTLV